MRERTFSVDWTEEKDIPTVPDLIILFNQAKYKEVVDGILEQDGKNGAAAQAMWLAANLIDNDYATPEEIRKFTEWF